MRTWPSSGRGSGVPPSGRSTRWGSDPAPTCWPHTSPHRPGRPPSGSVTVMRVPSAATARRAGKANVVRVATSSVDTPAERPIRFQPETDGRLQCLVPPARTARVDQASKLGRAYCGQFGLPPSRGLRSGQRNDGLRPERASWRLAPRPGPAREAAADGQADLNQLATGDPFGYAQVAVDERPRPRSPTMMHAGTATSPSRSKPRRVGRSMRLDAIVGPQVAGDDRLDRPSPPAVVWLRSRRKPLVNGRQADWPVMYVETPK